MAIIRTPVISVGTDLELGVNVDDVAEEAVSAYFKNETNIPVTILLLWKNNSEVEYTHDGVSAEYVQAIPPGQRKWVYDANGDIDMDLSAFRMWTP